MVFAAKQQHQRAMSQAKGEKFVKAKPRLGIPSAVVTTNVQTQKLLHSVRILPKLTDLQILQGPNYSSTSCPHSDNVNERSCPSSLRRALQIHLTVEDRRTDNQQPSSGTRVLTRLAGVMSSYNPVM